MSQSLPPGFTHHRHGFFVPIGTPTWLTPVPDQFVSDSGRRGRKKPRPIKTSAEREKVRESDAERLYRLRGERLNENRTRPTTRDDIVGQDEALALVELLLSSRPPSHIVTLDGFYSGTEETNKRLNLHPDTPRFYLGPMARAHLGVLFVDEVGELKPESQTSRAGSLDEVECEARNRRFPATRRPKKQDVSIDGANTRHDDRNGISAFSTAVASSQMTLPLLDCT